MTLFVFEFMDVDLLFEYCFVKALFRRLLIVYLQKYADVKDFLCLFLTTLPIYMLRGTS